MKAISSLLGVGDIFRAHFQDYLKMKKKSATTEQHQVAQALMQCHTAALGGHMMKCNSCGQELPAYNSCRNRHCPGCQGHKAAEWVEARKEELLPVGYFHLVFTLPHIFNQLVLYNKKLMYELLFQAVSKTLLQIGEKNLKCKLGFFSILHSWGQTLTLHPHLHIVLPGCGLASNGKSVIHFKKKYLVCDKILSEVFRAKFIELLKRSYNRGEINAYFDNFEQFLNLAVAQNWVVKTKPPFAGPAVVLKYLARYTHRVAISNRRLLSFKEGLVSFSYLNYRTMEKKIMSLSATEFIHRFLLHTLPKRFVRVRYYGFLTRSKQKTEFLLIQKLLSTETAPNLISNLTLTINCKQEKQTETATNPHRQNCPLCHRGLLIKIIDSKRLPTTLASDSTFNLPLTATAAPT